MTHASRFGLIGEQPSCKAIHQHRRHLACLVLLPLQQHLCSVPRSIDIERELLKPELLVRMLAEPVVVPSNIENTGEGESHDTEWQAR